VSTCTLFRMEGGAVRVDFLFCFVCVEIAVNFKDQGNEYFKGRRFREAVGFYTQGIDAKPTDPAVREALLINRAACNLELRASPIPQTKKKFSKPLIITRKLRLSPARLLRGSDSQPHVRQSVVSLCACACCAG
jgi:hypothetical protein